MPAVAFGGVGTSGAGSYRGRFGFVCFSHVRTVAAPPNFLEPLMRVRYMPFRWGELQRMRRMTGGKPDFDRDGRVVKGLWYWVKMVLTLRLGPGAAKGDSGVTGALLRWAVLLGCVYYRYFGLTLPAALARS